MARLPCLCIRRSTRAAPLLLAHTVHKDRQQESLSPLTRKSYNMLLRSGQGLYPMPSLFLTHHA